MMLWLLGSTRAPVWVAEPPPSAAEKLDAARCAAVPFLAADAGGAAALGPSSPPAPGADAPLALPDDELAAPEQAAMSSPAPVRRTAQETAVMRDGIPRPRDEPLALPRRVARGGWPVRCPIGVSMLLGRARPTGGSPARR